MAPVIGTDLPTAVEKFIKENHVMIFSKTTCPFCRKVSYLFSLHVTLGNSLLNMYSI